jgi:hypothetical protein
MKDDHRPATIRTATNQSARQNWPRFADEDVLTARPSSRKPLDTAGIPQHSDTRDARKGVQAS